jgi:hypothetical protein
MKDKYYTPTIEEFHVGFEYESSYLEDYDTWKKEIIDTVDVGYFYSTYTGDAVPTEFRVKYLDREDIESFGFVFKGGDTHLTYHSGGYAITHAPSSNKIDIYYYDGYEFVSNIVIKNKSELKRLLKQLNI